MNETKTLLTEQQAAKYMAVSVAALRKWRVQGRGPTFHKLGTLVRYRIDDIEAWLASRPQGGEPVSATEQAGGTR
jgi:excisionase family DNA binding protein